MLKSSVKVGWIGTIIESHINVYFFLIVSPVPLFFILISRRFPSSNTCFMKKSISFAFLLLGILFFNSCKPGGSNEPKRIKTQDIDAKVANAWFTLSLKLAKETPGFTAPVAARAFAYTGLALYESVVGGMSEFHTLQGHITNFLPDSAPEPENSTDYHWGVSANRALAYVISNLYKNTSPENLTQIKALEDQFEAEFAANISQEIFDRSKAYGDQVGVGVYKYSKSDGQDEAYNNNYPATYNVLSFQGSWIPTPPTYQTKPQQPYWGNVRTFIEDNATSITVAAHPPYSNASTSVFFVQALEIYTSKEVLTSEQKNTAAYWFDEPGKSATPAGHAISILKQVLEAQNANLAVAAEAYSKLGIGLHDATVACWKTKYKYDLLRPVSYIKANIDPTYLPTLSTPPYPEYTALNAVQSAAMAQILSDLFGIVHTFVDKANVSRTDITGTERTYTSFWEAADESAISAFYAGHNFRTAVENGKKQGIQVGKNVSAMQFRK